MHSLVLSSCLNKNVPPHQYLNWLFPFLQRWLWSLNQSHYPPNSEFLDENIKRDFLLDWKSILFRMTEENKSAFCRKFKSLEVKILVRELSGSRTRISRSKIVKFSVFFSFENRDWNVYPWSNDFVLIVFSKYKLSEAVVENYSNWLLRFAVCWYPQDQRWLQFLLPQRSSSKADYQLTLQ